MCTRSFASASNGTTVMTYDVDFSIQLKKMLSLCVPVDELVFCVVSANIGLQRHAAEQFVFSAYLRSDVNLPSLHFAFVRPFLRYLDR